MCVCVCVCVCGIVGVRMFTMENHLLLVAIQLVLFIVQLSGL